MLPGREGHRRPYAVLDAHCHAGTGAVLGHSGDGADDLALARYVQQARRAGIDGAVLFAPLTNDHRRANERAGRIARARPDRWVWFLLVHPGADRGRVEAVVAQAVATGCRGLKVHWSDGPITAEIGMAARRHGLPVIYDPRGDLARVEWAARRFDDVAWIIPHLSSFADDWRAQTGLIGLLERVPNLFTDTAGVRYADVLSAAVERAGPHKVLFGTDGPLLHPAVEWAKIEALDLPLPSTALIAGGNLLRLLRRR